nr:hypothetical protein [Tanacetum cinerariifolium]
NRPTFYDDDDDDVDYTIAITPILSTEEPDNSLSMGDEHLDNIPATESDEVLKSSVENLIPIPSESEGIPEHMCDVPFDNSPPATESDEVLKSSVENLIPIPSESEGIREHMCDVPFDNSSPLDASPPDSELVNSEVMEIVIPEVGGIDDEILLTIKDDILHEKLLNVNLLISKIKALNDNPTPSFDCKTKSPSTSLNSLLEETNTSNNSLPEFETFCFDVEEISSGSTTTHSDSLFYASFIFDLSINPLPPTDMSDFYEFTDELIPFISPPEYNCFLAKVEPNSRDFTKDVVEDISPTKEPQIHNALPTHPNLQLNMKFQLSSEYLFTYVVWIFLPFLVYSVVPHYILSLRNEDTIFDPDICNSHFSRPDISHRSDFTHEEFADELAHIISPPEYDCFLFKVKPNLRDFTKDVVEDISPTKEPQVHNALPTHPNLQLNMKFQPSSEYLFTYVVWIFLPFLCKLLAVGSPFLWKWEHPPQAVGTYTASGNSLLAVGMPCAWK